MHKPWMKHLATAMEGSAKLADAPLFGNPPPFTIDPLIEKLQLALELPQLEIEASGQGFREAGQLLEGFGDAPSVLSFSLTPLPHSLFWVMAQEDVQQIASWTLTEGGGDHSFQDPDMQKGFYHFLFVKALKAFRDSAIYSDFSPKLDKSSIPTERCFAIDISLRNQGETLWGRILIPPAFQQAMRAHYASPIPSVRELKTKGSTMLETTLIAGHVQLIPSELDSLKVGDFVILDHCNFHPDTKKGYLQLNLANHPLVQVKVKDEQLKVLDYAYPIEGQPMDNQEDLPQDSQPIENILNEDEGLPPIDDPLESALPPIGEGVPASEGGAEAATEVGAQEGIEAEVDAMAPIEEGQAMPEEEPLDEIQTAPEQPVLHPKQVPLTLSIEVAKLNISLEKLIELQPGNVLKTGVHPERGVYLNLNGRIVGKGELLQIGDALGVKITELADS